MKKRGKKKSRLKNWIINLFLLLLLVVGLALVFNNQIKNFLIQQNGEKYSVATVSAEEIKQNEAKETTFDFAGVVPASTEAVLKAQLSNKRLPVIGGVAVPSVGINLPIFKGLTNEGLLWGAGTMDPDQVMGEGNYALASHRTYVKNLLFTPLEDVSIGEMIYLTDLTNVYTYKIYDKVRVAPTDVQYLDPVEGKKVVTLITCGDMDAVTRIIVQGELQSVTPVAEAPEEVANAFNLEQHTF